MYPDSQPIQMPEINFQALDQPPALDENLLHQIDNFIKSTDWTQCHQCITMIRQINKHYPQYLLNMMQRYSNPILQLFNQKKTQNTKNILRLLKEIFDVGQQQNVEGIVSVFLPTLLKKAATDIGHIKQMAQLVLASLAANCPYNKSFQLSAINCCEKSAPVSEVAMKLLTLLVQSVGASITAIDPSALSYIMKAMYYLIEGKRQNMKKMALDICMLIYGQMGSDNYVKLMEYALSQEEIQKMAQNMETHRVDKKAKHIPLADILKARHSSALRQNSQNYPYNQYQSHNPFSGYQY